MKKIIFIRRGLSVLLTAAMLVGLMPGSVLSVSAEDAVVSAVETPDFSDAKEITKANNGSLIVGGTTLEINTSGNYITIPEGNYKLAADITIDVYIRTEGTVGIDLNGYTLDMSAKYWSVRGGEFSLYDTSTGGAGKITSSFYRTIALDRENTIFNLCSGTVENTSDRNQSWGVDSGYGSSNLYGGKIKSNAYAVYYYMNQDITIKFGSTSFECGERDALIKTWLGSYSSDIPQAVIDVSEYTGEALTVDAAIDQAVEIKFFTGISENEENYKVNFSCSSDYDLFLEKEVYNKETGEKTIVVSSPCFTQQPTKENDYTVKFNHPDATFQWSEKIVFSTIRCESKSELKSVSCEVKAGDCISLYAEPQNIDTDMNLYIKCIDENGEVKGDIEHYNRNSVSKVIVFESDATVSFSCMSWDNVSYLNFEHFRETELDGEDSSQLTKLECEKTYLCKATVGKNIYYSDGAAVRHTWEYSVNDNVISGACSRCGTTYGKLTLTADSCDYDGNPHSATVTKEGTLENAEVTVNYYQGDTFIGSDAPENAGTYIAKITYKEQTASVTYTIRDIPKAGLFTYTSSAVYDATEKSAEVMETTDITGMGEITVKYYQNDTEVTPVNAGTYTVVIDVAQGEDYAAFTGIEIGTFEITKADIHIVWENQSVAATGEEVSIIAPKLEFAGDDNPKVETVYSYKTEEEKDYTNGLPSACGTYDLKVSVSETDNYNVAEKNIILTINCKDDNKDGICDACGTYMDGIGARLVGHSLTLDGSVGVNFYMELSVDVISDSTAFMEFTLPGGKTATIYVGDAVTEVISGKTYYKFKCEVNVAEMTDTIKAQLKSNVGNSKMYEYTVKEYADYLLAHKDENTEFAGAAALVEAMINYGSYAQIYAGYNPDDLAVGDKENLKSVDGVTLDAYTYTPNENETKVQFAGANLSLLSTTTLRMYFKITDVEAERVTFTYGGKALEKIQSGDYYYVELVGIPANRLDNDCVVTVNDGTNSFNVTYTPMAYCANIINRETTETRTESLKNLIKALVMYNREADAYINNENQ